MRAWLTSTLAAVSTAVALADGELDLGFAPPPEVGSNSPTTFAVVGGQAYLSNPGLEVSRLREDGSLDAGWQLAYPRKGAAAISGLPSGGLAMAFNFGCIIQYDDDSYVKPIVGGSWVPPLGSVLPGDDGSVTLISLDGVSRVRADGTVDPAFRIRVPLQKASNGIPFKGGVTDSQGRYVIIGDFQTPAPAVHSGMIRLLADGTWDAGWNPTSDLQADVNGNGLLVPLAISALPEDSVLIILDQEIVWIDAGGKVTRRLVNPAGNRLFATPIVQPDGKVIVGGDFFKWGNVPVTGLIRLNVDGSLDSSFSVTLDNPFVSQTYLDTQGRLWFSGFFHQVNGIERPGIARIQAYQPGPTNAVSLQAQITAAPARVATNEPLYLTAKVDGIPVPALQWLRDGIPLDGATNRGLRLSITKGNELGAFSLVLSNAFGSQKLDFPATALAVRSPRPGTEDASFSRALTNFDKIIQLLPLPDGRILVASGVGGADTNVTTALVGRLLADGGLDVSFGDAGVVRGRGRVETLVPLPGGGMLVTGEFIELGGQPAQGLAELDRDGKLVARAWPNLDIAHVSTALPLPDGKLIIAGRFNTVGGAPAFRLARLNADLTLDPAFHYPLTYWEFVDALALDARGRVLIAGERMYFSGSLTDPPRAGLNRLLADGSPDPAFHARTNGIRSIFVEPDGKLLVGMPPLRLDEDGNLITAFEEGVYRYASSDEVFSLSEEANHMMVRTPEGGVIYRSLKHQMPINVMELWRWKATGEQDFNFQCALIDPLVGYPGQINVTAATALADGSVLLNALVSPTSYHEPTPDQARRLHRILPDSDMSLRVKDVSGGQFRVALETQPGLSYEVYRRDQLTGGTATQIGVYTGDGYVIDLQTPANGDSTYLELRRH